MSDRDDTEFREEFRQVLRRHDPDSNELRNLATDLENLAEKYELQEEVI